MAFFNLSVTGSLDSALIAHVHFVYAAVMKYAKAIRDTTKHAVTLEQITFHPAASYKLSYGSLLSRNHFTGHQDNVMAKAIRNALNQGSGSSVPATTTPVMMTRMRWRKKPLTISRDLFVDFIKTPSSD